MSQGFIGNTKSKIYHRLSCFNVPQSEARRIVFETRADAVTAGYKPCGMCRSDKGGNQEMAKINEATVDVVEQETNLTITLTTRHALWRDSNTGSGTAGYLPAGTYDVIETANGFSRIDGGWVHRVPEIV
jgi:hypothetical protein